VPVHRIKVYWGVEIQLYIYLISELGEIERPSLSWYTLNWRLDDFQSRCGYFGKVTFFLPLPGNHDSSVVRPIALSLNLLKETD